jgi:quinol monooxygenase YgiN
MLFVLVHLHVKPDCVAGFKAATLDNDRLSVQEPGIAQFDLLQQQDAPTRFTLIEAYQTAAAPAKHKETAHDAVWRDIVAAMMAESRSSTKYTSL